MGKGIKEDARAQELEPVSLGELIHRHVRIAIETAVHEELRAALGDESLRAPRRSTRLPQWRKSADAHGTDWPGRAHVATGDPFQWCRRRERMDVENRPALSTANAGGQ
jgi:hypothetical protein